MDAQQTEIRYESLGNLDVGQIWGTKRHGVFVVVSSRPAKWRGEDIDVYAHVDTWYTIRPATEAETALWNEAVAASTARQELRQRLGADRSYEFDAAKRQLVSRMTRLDSYDDRWSPPAPIDLDDESFAIEQEYVDALARLHIGK
jgi:hypothetical protein